MNQKKKIRAWLTTAVMLFGTVFMVAPSARAATPTPYDPSCLVVENTTWNGYSFPNWATANFTSNPCSRPVRVAVWCANLGTTGSTEYFGGTIYGTGTSTYTCDITQSIAGYGWQEYYLGQWITYLQ